jgi:hypothetical protein
MVGDAAKWEQGRYDPEKIADFWRSKLDRKTVAGMVAEIAQKP